LNDPFEFLAANLGDAKLRRAFSAMKNKLEQTKGMICLSKSWTNPLLWGHYADKHFGIALGFEISDESIFEVIYSKNRVGIPVHSVTKQTVLSNEFIQNILRTKFIDWQYEQECRVFVQLDESTQESGLYYKDFSPDFKLTDVILGPRCDLPIKKIRLLVSNNKNPVRVIESRMAFRTFRVVENKA
jgi:hypothetical protein